MWWRSPHHHVWNGGGDYAVDGVGRYVDDSMALAAAMHARACERAAAPGGGAAVRVVPTHVPQTNLLTFRLERRGGPREAEEEEGGEKEGGGLLGEPGVSILEPVHID
jgi:hypothetical protein